MASPWIAASRTEAATRDRIAALPKGAWANELLTDGYDSPVKLACKVSIGNAVNVAFTGTDPVNAKGINVPII